MFIYCAELLHAIRDQLMSSFVPQLYFVQALYVMPQNCL